MTKLGQSPVTLQPCVCPARTRSAVAPTGLGRRSATNQIQRIRKDSTPIRSAASLQGHSLKKATNNKAESLSKPVLPNLATP